MKTKHILVGISGGIAAFKIPQLIRLLTREGAEVRIVLTQNALQFVTETTLQTLTGYPVYKDVFAPYKEHETEHISLADWADAMIIAPATANIIGKMANGIADDALSTTFLALRKPVLVCPAMNEKMFLNPIVQGNIEKLKTVPWVRVMPPATGALACGTNGLGRMPEVEEIFEKAKELCNSGTLELCNSGTLELCNSGTLAGKRVLLTAGPTREKIDPVRYISNFSTGKMGYALARACLQMGAEVTLISGPVSADVLRTLKPWNSETLKLLKVETAEEMYQAAVEHFADADIAILSAAVADFKMAEVAEQKIKRVGDDLVLRLVPNPDIAAELGKRKRADQLLVGFALETNDAMVHAKDKMQRKNLDYIVLNTLEDAGAGFGFDTNKVTVIARDGQTATFPLKSKTELAEDILLTLSV